jgi:hypothetical protein
VAGGVAVAEGVADGVLATVEVGDAPPAAVAEAGEAALRAGVDEGGRVAEAVDDGAPVGVDVDAGVGLLSSVGVRLAVEAALGVRLAVPASASGGVEAGRGRTSTNTSTSKAANTATSATHSSVGVTASRRESPLLFLFITLFPLDCQIGHALTRAIIPHYLATRPLLPRRDARVHER